MIKIPNSDLVKKLQAIQPKDDSQEAGVEAQKEHDRVLAEAWNSARGESREAIDYLLAQLESSVVISLQTPDRTADARQFLAGQLNSIYAIQAMLDKTQNFDPDDYDYQPEFGDPDAVEGTGDDIPY